MKPIHASKYLHHRARLPLARLLLILLLTQASLAVAQFDVSGGEEEEILTARTLTSLQKVAPADTVWLAVRLSLATGWHVNSATPIQDYLIPTSLELTVPVSANAGEPVYPPGKKIPLLGEEMSVYESGATIFVPVAIKPDAALGPLEIKGLLSYQGCDNKSCVAADELELSWPVEIAAKRGEAVNPEVFAQVTGGASSSQWNLDLSTAQTGATNELERLVEKHGNWGYALALLLAFGTGLLLSFSPCTYPMIPITVSIFAGQARGMGRGFVLSLFYVLTMALIYGAMGAIVASVGGVFGAWLAHPVVVGLIVAIFVIFALSMFGLYELQVPGALRNRMAGRGGGGVGGAIVLGAVAALVVSPCVGPFVAGIMLYIATTGSALLGFVILFTFALGLGALFMLIGTFSSAIQALPHAGVWMESVKKFFGFVLLLMALYFLRTLIATELTAILAGLMFLAAGVYGGGFDRLTAEAAFFPRLKKVFGVLCTIIGIYLLGGYLVTSGFVWPPVKFAGGEITQSAPTNDKIPWVTDLDRGLQLAQESNQPVLIDTWATWCANCYKLDETTWSDDQVAAEAKRFVPLKLQLEKGDSPETKRFMQLFGLKQYSLPSIILIDSHGRVQDIVQGYLPPGPMLERMKSVT